MPIEELHEVLANGLLVLIALHVGGVILSSVRHRENLTRSMVTGDKRAPEDGRYRLIPTARSIAHAPRPSDGAFFLTAS
ncbi:MAG: hypothetical protein U5K36_13065 [Roseovarius sp.]|nr:hypothetical protein [Roseovarius sp.]